MDDSDEERVRYADIQVSGRAKVHAGSSAVNINIQNLIVNNEGFDFRQFFGAQDMLQQPAYPSLPSGVLDTANVASPSQSSDSTGMDPESTRLLTEHVTTELDVRASYRVIQTPTHADRRYKYFLDGQGLEQHIVFDYLPCMAGRGAEVGRANSRGRSGFLVYGQILDDEQLLELRRLSRQYARQRRVDRHVTSRG